MFLMTLKGENLSCVFVNTVNSTSVGRPPHCSGRPPHCSGRLALLRHPFGPSVHYKKKFHSSSLMAIRIFKLLIICSQDQRSKKSLWEILLFRIKSMSCMIFIYLNFSSCIYVISFELRSLVSIEVWIMLKVIRISLKFVEGDLD